MRNPSLQNLLYLLIFLITLGCQSKSHNKENENRIDQQSAEDFELFYTQFIEDFNVKNTRHLNRYIDEEDGLLIIATEGIYSIPHKFPSFAKFMEYVGEENVTYIQKAKINNSLKYGAKPLYDCQSQRWNRDGCYWNDKPKPNFTALYDVLMEHHIITHDQSMEEEIKSVDILATRLVYDTENNMGFYFNRMNNKWVLLCIERVLPCGN